MQINNAGHKILIIMQNNNDNKVNMLNCIECIKLYNKRY